MNHAPNRSPDRLYDLLPLVYRQRDADQGYPLRGLLRVITEQVNVVEDDIGQLYANWFIETAADWAVPYIGELVGYRIAHEAGEPGDITTAAAAARNKILIPRREVANTIRYRRRKGTLALLELLAHDVAGWPARAVEFYRLLSWMHSMNHQRPTRGRTVDLRAGNALDLINGPFDQIAHSVDVRRISSHRSQGRHNIPNVGLYVWRLKPYAVTCTQAYCLEDIGVHCFTFSALGNDAPLFTNPAREEDPGDIAGELNVPAPIRRRALAEWLADYYGPDKSLYIWRGSGSARSGVITRSAVPLEKIMAADLTDWRYQPPRGFVAVDPVLGRIAFSTQDLPRQGLWVSYHYGFSADMGGGEYRRALSQPADAVIYRVTDEATGKHEYARINDAIAAWHKEQPRNAVIEIAQSAVYVEQINFTLAENQSMQLRAANGVRPILRLLDWQTDRPDSLWIQGAAGSRFTLDGILVTGRGMQVEGPIAAVDIRHSTLVPGWSLQPDCGPRRPVEPSLELFNLHSSHSRRDENGNGDNNEDEVSCKSTLARVTIEQSIIGSIQVTENAVTTDPILITIRDSILDATAPDREAIGAPEWPLAHATLTIERSTVIGYIQTHAIELAENSIFEGKVTVARSQIGCMRFCYVSPGSRTPPRYHCQPDLVARAAGDELHAVALAAKKSRPSQNDVVYAQELAADQIQPRFNSNRYGRPGYCQLADPCPEEITRGADDESEMGAFHDLYQPQRAANLRARLDEYTPAGMDVGIIFAS